MGNAPAIRQPAHRLGQPGSSPRIFRLAKQCGQGRNEGIGHTCGGAHGTSQTHGLMQQVTFEPEPEDLLRQKWQDLKRDHHELDSTMSPSEKGPLSGVPGARYRRTLVRVVATEDSGTKSGPWTRISQEEYILGDF